jgi:hypothetical protein
LTAVLRTQIGARVTNFASGLFKVRTFLPPGMHRRWLTYPRVCLPRTQLGVKKGESVGIQSPNRPEWVSVAARAPHAAAPSH